MTPVTVTQIVQDFDLRTKTPNWLGNGGIKAEDFKGFLDDHLLPAQRKDCRFYNHCQAFLDSEGKNGENAVFNFCHSIHESDWGRSYIAHRKLNFRGYGAVDNNPVGGAYAFKAVDDSILAISAKIKRNYLMEGGKYSVPFTEKEFDHQLRTNKAWASSPENLARWREKRLRCKEVKPFTLECLNERYASHANWDTSIAQLMKQFVEYVIGRRGHGK